MTTGEVTTRLWLFPCWQYSLTPSHSVSPVVQGLCGALQRLKKELWRHLSQGAQRFKETGSMYLQPEPGCQHLRQLGVCQELQQVLVCFTEARHPCLQVPLGHQQLDSKLQNLH